MKIAILDYSSGNLDVIDVPTDGQTDVESYLSEVMEYNLNNIDWMEVKSINIEVSV